MSDAIKRFDPSTRYSVGMEEPYMREDPHGDYVEYEAWQAERAAREAAEQRVREVEALPAKWRNQPDSGQPEAVCECADDLEAALQGTGSGSADNG